MRFWSRKITVRMRVLNRWRRRIARVVWLVAMTCAWTIACADDMSPLWKIVGPWQVRVDPTFGHGCFIMASYGKSQIVRIGFDNNTKSSYMWLSDSSWHSLEAGKTYDLRVQFTGSDPMSWEAYVGTIGNPPPITFLGIQVDNSLWQLVSERAWMRVTYQGRQLMNINLVGTVEAVRTAAECNTQFITPDPFAASLTPAPLTR
jgi:hypothetical protein